MVDDAGVLDVGEACVDLALMGEETALSDVHDANLLFQALGVLSGTTGIDKH